MCYSTAVPKGANGMNMAQNVGFRNVMSSFTLVQAVILEILLVHWDFFLNFLFCPVDHVLYSQKPEWENVPFVSQSLKCYLEPVEISAGVSISKRSLKANIIDSWCMQGRKRWKAPVMHLQENIWTIFSKKKKKKRLLLCLLKLLDFLKFLEWFKIFFEGENFFFFNLKKDYCNFSQKKEKFYYSFHCLMHTRT